MFWEVFTTFLEIPIFPLFRYFAFWEYFLFCDIAVNYKISINWGLFWWTCLNVGIHYSHVFFLKVQRFSKEAYDSPKVTWNLWAGDKLLPSTLLHPLKTGQALPPQSKSSNKQMEQGQKMWLLHVDRPPGFCSSKYHVTFQNKGIYFLKISTMSIHGKESGEIKGEEKQAKQDTLGKFWTFHNFMNRLWSLNLGK